MSTELLTIVTGEHEQVIDVTGRCREFLRDLGAQNGLLHVFVPHATAGVAVVETAAGSDHDLLVALRELLPPEGPTGHGWSHQHGSHGHGRDHVVPALVAPFAMLPVVDGELALGTWQSVCLVDTNVDNPHRTVRLTFLAGA